MIRKYTTHAIHGFCYKQQDSKVFFVFMPFYKPFQSKVHSRYSLNTQVHQKQPTIDF